MSERGKVRKSVDINDRLICKCMYGNGETIADRLAGGEMRDETPTR